MLDFDIPFAYAFVMAAAIELVATIGIMASVTWPVLIVGIFATAASKYVQVRTRFCTISFFSLAYKFFYSHISLLTKGILSTLRSGTYENKWNHEGPHNELCI